MLEEIPDINRRMFETFKPPGVRRRLRIGYAYDAFDSEWSPAEDLNEAVKCRPEGSLIVLTVGDAGSTCCLAHHGLWKNPEVIGCSPAAATCLALLAWKDSQHESPAEH